MRKLSIALTGLFITLSFSQTQHKLPEPYVYCFVDGKECTLEEVGKIFKGDRPQRCDCFYIDNRELEPMEAFTLEGKVYKIRPSVYPVNSGRKSMLRIFIETENLNGKLEIPSEWEVIFEFAPETNINAEIINHGKLGVRQGLFYLSGRLVNTETGFISASLLPVDLTIENRGFLDISLNIGNYAKISNMTTLPKADYSRLKRLVIRNSGSFSLNNADAPFPGTVEIENTGKMSISENFKNTKSVNIKNTGTLHIYEEILKQWR